MSGGCRAPSTAAVGARVRKVMSREFSDSEVHQRVRRKPCTALSTWKPQWQDGMELPRSLISCLSMLDLVSSHDDSSGSSQGTSRDREGSWCSLAGSALSVLIEQQPGKAPRFRRVMSAGVLETKTKGQELSCPRRGSCDISDSRLSPLPSESSGHDSLGESALVPQQRGFSGAAAAAAMDAASALAPECPPVPPPPPPSRFKSLVPTCFQWFGACHMVYLAGSFNEWKERIPLQSCGRNRDWAVVLNLPPGEYTYKYVVQATADDGLSWHHAPDQPAGRDQLGNVNNFATVVDQTEYEVEESEDAGYSQHVPDDDFFVAPEPPSLPPQLQHLMGAPHGPPAGDGGPMAVAGAPGGWVPEGLPLQRSGVSGIMDEMRLSEGEIESESDAPPPGAPSWAEVSHSAVGHVCVSMDWSHADPGSCQPRGGEPTGQAAAGHPSLPPAITLSVTHRHRGRVIETVLVRPARPCSAEQLRRLSPAF